ncbi:P2 family phage major capsid protein, partial [Enterobacter hormaechei]
IENPKKDRIENYESMNTDYVVEAYAAGCLIENIKLGEFAAPAAPESASAPVDNEGGE